MDILELGTVGNIQAWERDCSQAWIPGPMDRRAAERRRLAVTLGQTCPIHSNFSRNVLGQICQKESEGQVPRAIRLAAAQQIAGFECESRRV